MKNEVLSKSKKASNDERAQDVKKSTKQQNHDKNKTIDKLSKNINDLNVN